jgi:hypothetical protein
MGVIPLQKMDRSFWTSGFIAMNSGGYQNVLWSIRMLAQQDTIYRIIVHHTHSFYLHIG